MKIKLIAPENKNFSGIEQILVNRKIPAAKIFHYLNTTEKDINDYLLFGKENLKAAAMLLLTCIQKTQNAILIVDCDSDGYSSAALLYNYLYKLFPSWVEKHLDYFLHEDKTHGLSDCYEYIIEQNKYNLVLCPDSSSADYDFHKILKEADINVLVLDHHLAPKVSEYAITINNQLSDYPNKSLSGVAVTWQFCRYLDDLCGADFSNNFIDLVSFGLISDVMSLLDNETRYLVKLGLSNIKNPFLYYMIESNRFKIGDTLTPTGIAFYVTPFVNAITRSGSLEEKYLVFEAFLLNKAFKEMPSTKSGHKGELEKVVEQAVRVVKRVKNRQSKAQNEEMEALDKIVHNKNLLEHKMLVLLADKSQVDKNLAGLVAMKFAAKYQRPCCVLTKGEYNGKICYSGSARNYSTVDLPSLKSVLEESGCVEYAAGHDNAFGLCIQECLIDKFIDYTDEHLPLVSYEKTYLVDYLFDGYDIMEQVIVDIGLHPELWGKDVEEPYIAIQHLKVKPDMVTLLSPDKHPTIKIKIPNSSATLIKFNASEEEYEQLTENPNGYVEILVVGKCGINDYWGTPDPQLLIEEYEITNKARFLF
jgi:single-stranded-DNA-specific exonuclease